MAGNWWDADKIDGPESAGNWWDADAVVKDDAPSAATAGPDAKGDGFFSMERAKGVLSSLANAVPFVGADDGKPNPFAEYVKGAAERARGNLPVLEDGTLKPAEPKKFKSVLETQAWPDAVPSDDELRRLSRRDYAKAQEDEARRIRTGGHEMRATKPAPVLSAAEAGAKRFAEDNPVTASIKSSAAQSLAGLANAPSAAAQAGNEMVRNAMIGFGADVPASRVPNMPLVDDLMKMSGAYTSELQRRAPGEAWDRGEFGQWLLTQLGGNSMNTIQSLGALMVPGMQGALLTSMGATAAGTSYATGDSGIASIGKGVVEAASEKLPLEAAGFATKKVSSLIEKIPAASRNAILQDAGRRLVAAGGAVTFNSLVGAIEESAAQIGGNAIDIAIDGKTKSLFDEVDRAAIVGAAANTSMAAPAIIEAARRPTTDAGRLAGELADALNGGQFAQAGIDQTVSDMLRTVGTSDNIAPTSTSMAAAAGERARLEQMRAPRPTVADIGKAASVDEAIATAEQSVAPDVPPSVQPAQAAQVPAGTGRAVQLDEADLLKRAMAGIDMPQEAAQPALAQAAPVVEQQAAPEAATPAAQDQPVRTWFGRRGDGYATPEDAQRGLSERQRLQKDLQWRIEQTPEGRYRLAGYAAPVGGTQALQTPSPQAVREAQDAVPVAAAAQPVPVPQVQAQDSGSDRELLGRDFVPLADGGKTFRTQKAAKLAQGQQKHLRVLQHQDGGFYLAPKTPAQLAAEAKASQRLGRANTSAAGMPIPAHAFIAAAGGMQAGTRADMGVDGNPRIGNRTLFAGAGKGLSLERATEMLVAEGYLRTGASHSDALALLKRSLTNPQYTAEGFERMAQADEQARFEDYLAAQEEAAAEGDADPFGMADEFTAEELDEVGYTDADPALQAEVAALIAQAEAIGIDTLAILEDIARTYANATQDQYNAAARDALAQAIARGNQDGGSTAAQAAPAAEPAADQGLDPTPALDLASQTPAEWQTDSASERFSVGSSLTKEQRRQVLASLVDAYKAKGAQREFKGLDGNGNERYGYTYSPDLFEKSDITGAMVRYYVTLPDGRIAHPSELFPDVSASDVERMALEQDTKRVRLDAYENAIKPYYSDFESANLMAVRGQVVIKKSGRFAIIPERTGAIGQARQNGWELASPSGQVSEQSAGTRAGREQQDGLTSYTAEEAAQRQEEAAQAAKAETARQRAADAQAARDDERKRIAQASVRAADNFELGQDPLDSLTGQGSIFDAPAQSAPTAASDDEGRERFTLSIEMFGDVPYRASKPVDADGGEVVSSRVITTKTKLTKAQAQSLGLPADKGQVFAWRVSVVRGDGGVYPAIEVMAQDHGRSPDGEVLAHFKPVDTPETVERVAPAVMKAAAADLQAAQDADADTLPGFSRSASTKAAYEARIDALFAGGKPTLDGVRVLDRSDMLALLGMGDGPVNLAEGKVTAGQDNHPHMTAAMWKKIPQWLDNPALVFDSDTTPGRLVFIAPELVNGAPVRIIVEPNAAGSINAHLLVNAYDAERNPFQRWEREGLLRYFDQQKAPSISGTFQPRLTGLPGNKRRGKILTQKHLAGYRRANDPQRSSAPQPSTTGATVATITDAIRKAYGNVLDKLQAKGLVTLVQSQDDAIEAAAQARAAKTGQPVEQARSTLRASVKNSVADQTQTEAFRKWFGDSKVVDADGNPLRVYHGTTADFSAFDPDTVGDNFGRDKEGFFFTGSTVEASGYADERSQFLAAGIPDNPPQTPREGANVMPVYLSLQNPLTLERYTWAIASTPETEIDEQGISLIDFFDGSNGDVVRYAQANGHDGVLLQRGGKTLAVAFLPEQIKSAIGNRGTFDPADPDIRRSSNGSIQGFFDPQSGQSFMIADGLTNEAAPGVLVHEVGIHMAADTSSDKGKAAFDKIVERAGQLLELGRGNVFFDRVNQRMRDAGETSNEEAAAYIAEEYERDRVNAPASVKRWVTDFMAAVRAWLFGKGVLVKASDLGAADIAAIARANVRKAARGDGMLSGDGSVRRSDASPTEDEVRGLMQQYADVAGAPTEAQMRAAVQDYRETERAYGGKPAYDKARAAGKTKLNYGQWVQTRTQHFKNWFGDWQALAAQERLDAMEPIKVRVPDAWQNLPVNELRQRVEESLLQLMESGEPLHHPEVGEVSVVRKGIKKALASSADPAKLRVLGDLRHAFEWSFLAGTQAAQGEEHNVLAYDKLLARLDVGGSEVVAVFTVKRLTDGSQFYNTVALDDGQNKTPVASPRDTPIAGEHATSANTGVSDFVRRPLARVKPDSVSKVVDPQTGEPAVVFHGTHGDFSEFNAQDRVSTDSGMLGSGHYFTPDPKRAGDWYATRRDRETGAALAGGNVMPVFLNARDPLEIRLQAGQDLQSVLVEMSRDMGLERMPSMSNDEANAKWAPLFTQSLRERGHDGVRLVLSNGVTQEVSVFDGTSAKSATGNIGTFGESRDIRFSYATAAAQGSTYTLPEERFGGLRRKMQDYFIRALEVQNAVARQGGTVDEQTDFYRAEELSSGRRAALVQDFGNNVVQPLMERAAQLGIDLSELSLYAYAKHAQERNEYIATINDRLPDGGSGMTTADANAIMDKVRQEGREQDFEELHQGLMDITASTRALQLSEGLITQDEFDAMQAQYQNYIPLRGFEQVDEDGKTTGRSPGKGFNIRGQENLRALGRSSRAGELIENAIHDYIRTVDRGERNQVGKVFLNFVLQNPDAGLWEVDATRTRAAMDHQTGKVKGVTSIDKGEDTIAVKVAGREVYVRIHDPLLLRAMRKSHTDDRGDNERLVVRALGLYTALLRNTLTRYNPEFALTNALRDYGFGMAAMVDVLGEKGAAKFTAHYAGAVAAAHRNELNKSDPKNREWDKYFTEFRLAGGMTAGFYVKNTEEIGRDIRSMLLAAGAAPKTKTEALFASSPARAIAAAGRVLEYAGSVSENAARVAAYRTAREMGKSPSEAASIAKNLTTNFDRKGELGQVINAAYVFYNAAVQGSHRLLKMLANPKVAVYMAGFGVAGLALALANADWGGDDPDDGMAYWDKIPAYEKERNLIIMLSPGAQMEGEERVGTQGRYVKIPLQYGLNLPVAWGYAIADVIRNQRDKSRGMSPVKAGVTMASYLAGAFNPFGGSVDLSNGSSMAQAALPSLGDAVVQFATGTNGFGRDVAPFKSPFDTKPDSENYNLRQADSVSLKIAQLLNRATGGSAAEEGGIDISAGTVENLIRNVSGGTGAFLYDVGNLAWKSVDRATGGDPDIFVREMPLARRMYGELGGDVDQGIFYDSRKKTQEAAGIVKRSAELDMEPSEENQTLASMDKFANKATRDLAKLRREMIRVKQDGSLSNAEKTKELRELRAARDQITAGFNQAFTEVMRAFFAEQKSTDKINQ